MLAAGVGLAIAPVLLSFAHPFGNPRNIAAAGPLLSGAEIPDPLREVIGRKCGNCHSESTEWPFYSRLAPVSWMVERDVMEAREHLNFSRWGTYSDAEKTDLLSRLAAKVRSGDMPPARYTAIHRDSILQPQEREALYEWARRERKRLRTETQQPKGGQ
jgi:cytochrome c